MDQNDKLPYEPHPYAELFPLDEGPPLWAMADQMKEDGFDERYKIVLFQGKILDGRRRQLAAHRAEVVPLYEEFEGDDEAALRFVMRANIHRRHLSTTEAAMIAARIADMTREQTLQKGRVFSDAREKASEKPSGVSQAQAAEMMGVSRTSVQNAKAVIDTGVQEPIDAIDRKEITLTQAAKVAREINKAVNAASRPRTARRSPSASHPRRSCPTSTTPRSIAC
jgi:ParB-like chromosome segregation protein Spo0J